MEPTDLHAIYELQDQVKTLLKRVEKLEAERCLCITCQTRAFLIWQAKDYDRRHNTQDNREEI